MRRTLQQVKYRYRETNEKSIKTTKAQFWEHAAFPLQQWEALYK